jgi:hypothetical protein
MKKRFLFIVFFLATTIHSAEVIEVPISPEDANIKLLAVLNKVDPDRFQENQKTAGFIHKYTDRWKSPFYYDIYIGRVSQRSVDSIIRIESPDRGQERVWKQVLEAELLKNPSPEDARRLKRKSHIATQMLNLAQPSFSVIYNSYDSPFQTTRDTFMASSFYILTDILLVGISYIYVKDKSPRKSLWDNIMNRRGPPEMLRGPDAGTLLGALAITRLYRMMHAVQDTRAHNRMVELEYSFNF